MTTVFGEAKGCLEGRRALVTGSTDGIGAGIARGLADAGAVVMVTGCDEVRDAAVTAESVDVRGVGACVVDDLLEGTSAVADLIETTEDALGGPIDILVNNAGPLIAPPSSDLSWELFDQTFAVSVWSASVLTGLLAPVMARRGGGAIVNVDSIDGVRPTPHSVLYNHAKVTCDSTRSARFRSFMGRAGSQRREPPRSLVWTGISTPSLAWPRNESATSSGDHRRPGCEPA
jgi:NAD(P)-dependent dehydrogenase (short-subunit alcohol dehydrogenase family)